MCGTCAGSKETYLGAADLEISPERSTKTLKTANLDHMASSWSTLKQKEGDPTHGATSSMCGTCAGSKETYLGAADLEIFPKRSKNTRKMAVVDHAPNACRTATQIHDDQTHDWTWWACETCRVSKYTCLRVVAR